ncbi:hypothetical protein RRG08_041181 [Elysia crispata]|uniref:Uncharacterized protein n=1 Tax=Elysia crispata TaxID=231223 RepID=A0AAE0XXY3_9GAST|nr:hypothetical protein RRG08_041181 [Elysia crispata]
MKDFFRCRAFLQTKAFMCNFENSDGWFTTVMTQTCLWLISDRNLEVYRVPSSSQQPHSNVGTNIVINSTHPVWNPLCTQCHPGLEKSHYQILFGVCIFSLCHPTSSFTAPSLSLPTACDTELAKANKMPDFTKTDPALFCPSVPESFWEF